MIDLEAIKARAEKASPGPWHKSYIGTEGRNEWVIIDREDESDAYVIAEVIPFVPPNDGTWKHNADFIANARTDIPALIARVEELEEKNRILDARLYMFEERHPGQACPHVHSLRIANQKIKEMEKQFNDWLPLEPLTLEQLRKAVEDMSGETKTLRGEK